MQLPEHKHKGVMLFDGKLFYEIEHYFDGSMNELYQLSSITNYKKPTVFNPPRKWGKDNLDKLRLSY